MIRPKPRGRFCATCALAATLCLTFLSGCDAFNGDDEVNSADHFASAPFSHNIPVADRIQIRMEAINGAIEIQGVPVAASIVITGERRVGASSTSDAEDHLSELHVRVTESDDEVFVRTDQPHDAKGRNYIVDYTISVPENLDIQIGHVNGTITLDDLQSNASVVLVNGEIDANMALPANGEIALALVNGNVDLEIPIATSAEVSCSVTNGDIHTSSNLDVHNMVSTAHSVTGRLGNGDGSIQLSTVNGTVRLTGN